MTITNTRSRLVLATAFTALALGCSSAPSEMPPAPTPDAQPPAPDASPPTPDASPPAPDASVDQIATADVTPVDLAADSPLDAPAPPSDAPKQWPPPGVEYLTKLATEADYKQLSIGDRDYGVVPFIIRRLANDRAYPYPWDRYECIFEHGNDIHLHFLEKMDPVRGPQLYYVDAKRVGGSLLPGRLSQSKTNPREVTVLFENFFSLLETSYFPLDPAVAPILRERIMRCAPFATTFKFNMTCTNGQPCPLP